MSSVPLRLQLITEDPTEDPHEKTGNYTNYSAFQVLKGYLEDDGQVSLDDAAKQLCEMMPYDERFLISSQEYDLSYLLVQIVRQIPYWHASQQKLVDLVRVLGQSPKLGRMIPGYRYPIFDKMRSFIRELYERHWHFLNEETDETELVNLSAFAARLESSGQLKPQSYFLWSMRDLEGEYPMTNTILKVTSVWALCSGQTHFTTTILYPPPLTPTYRQWYKTKALYNGPIFGRERWDFWQNRLAELSQGEEFDDEARKLGGKAADFMACLSRTLEW